MSAVESPLLCLGCLVWMLFIIRHNLYTMQNQIGSQCSSCSDLVTWSRRVRPHTRRSAAFWTHCRCVMVDFGRLTRIALQYSCRLEMKANTSLHVIVGPSICQTFFRRCRCVAELLVCCRQYTEVMYNTGKLDCDCAEI